MFSIKTIILLELTIEALGIDLKNFDKLKLQKIDKLTNNKINKNIIPDEIQTLKQILLPQKNFILFKIKSYKKICEQNTRMSIKWKMGENYYSFYKYLENFEKLSFRQKNQFKPKNYIHALKGLILLEIFLQNIK